MHVKTGDTVKIIGGKDKGKVSEIVRVNTFDSTVFVKDANLKTKHIKPQARGETGRIIQVLLGLFSHLLLLELTLLTTNSSGWRSHPQLQCDAFL